MINEEIYFPSTAARLASCPLERYRTWDKRLDLSAKIRDGDRTRNAYSLIGIFLIAGATELTDHGLSAQFAVDAMHQAKKHVKKCFSPIKTPQTVEELHEEILSFLEQMRTTPVLHIDKTSDGTPLVRYFEDTKDFASYIAENTFVGAFLNIPAVMMSVMIRAVTNGFEFSDKMGRRQKILSFLEKRQREEINSSPSRLRKEKMPKRGVA